MDKKDETIADLESDLDTAQEEIQDLSVEKERMINAFGVINDRLELMKDAMADLQENMDDIANELIDYIE